MKVLLSTAYWPNLHYFYYLMNCESVFIETHEHYQKQSFRNRTQILSANGKLDLVIPVKKQNEDECISNLQISYAEKWQIRHWRAITSAYKNSPYFEFFEDEIKHFYENEFPLLTEYNTAQLNTLLRILKLKKTIHFTSSYEKIPAHSIDLREKIHPKKKWAKDENIKGPLSKPYYQTFETKFNFTPNLSILDLVFNQGLETLTYFPKATLTL